MNERQPLPGPEEDGQEQYLELADGDNAIGTWHSIVWVATGSVGLSPSDVMAWRPLRELLAAEQERDAATSAIHRLGQALDAARAEVERLRTALHEVRDEIWLRIESTSTLAERLVAPIDAALVVPETAFASKPQPSDPQPAPRCDGKPGGMPGSCGLKSADQKTINFIKQTIASWTQPPSEGREKSR